MIQAFHSMVVARKVAATGSTGTPVDLFLDFENGTAGDILTTANLTAATRGNTSGTWDYEGLSDPLTHTKLHASNLDRRTPLAVLGVDYDGSGTRCVRFDMEAAGNYSGGAHPYDRFKWIPPGGLSIYDVSVTARYLFAADLSRAATGGTVGSVQIDLINIQHGEFTVVQYRFDGTTHSVLAHTSSTGGGGSIVAGSVAIPAATPVCVTLRRSSTLNRVEVVVTHGTTGALIGTAGYDSVDADGAVTQIVFGNYLIFGGGTIDIDNVAFDWTNAALPLEPITVPDVTGIALDQTASNTVRMSWTGDGLYYVIERKTGAGSWSVLDAYYFDSSPVAADGRVQEYVDSTGSNGDVYTYRVKAVVGDYESGYVESDPITITNSTSGWPSLWQSQANSSSSYAINNSVTTLAQEIKGISASAVDISSVVVHFATVSETGNATLSIHENADGTGTLYGTSVETTISATGNVEFVFFVPVEIPASTDFSFRINRITGAYQASNIPDSPSGYRTGEGYNAYRSGAEQTADLRFEIYRNIIPAAPSGVSAVEGDSGQATVSWTDTNDQGAEYAIDQWHSGSWTNLVATATRTQTSKLITGLTVGETYKWRVYSYISGETGSESSKVETNEITVSPPVFNYYSADFDGTNDYLTRGSDLTGIADSGRGLLSVWLKPDANNSYILANATPRIRVLLDSTARIQITGQNAANTTVLSIASNTSAVPNGSWTHVLVSWDLGTAGNRKIYINGSDQTNQTTFTTSETIDYTLTNWAIGSLTNGTAKFNGKMCELYFTSPAAYYDLTVQANREKFRTAGGLPEDLGADGSTPTGSQPWIYLRSQVPAWHNNQGSGGGFTLNGTLDDGTTDKP